MVDPTTLSGLGLASASRSTREAPADPEFDKVFQKTIEPPGEPPPKSPPPESEAKLEGPEESPTETPNAKSSQMDPQPQIPILSTGLTLPEIAGDPAEVAPTLPLAPALAPVKPLDALDIQAVIVTETIDPSVFLQKVPNPQAGTSQDLLELPAEPESEDSPDQEEPLFVSVQQKDTPRESIASNKTSEPLEIREASARTRAQVLDHIEVLAAKHTKVKIEMNPLDLGPMTVQVSQEGKEIKTHVVVENPALRYALDRAQAGLTVALSEAGMNLSQFSMDQGTPYEKPEGFAYMTPGKAFAEAKPNYQSASGGLELWA